MKASALIRGIIDLLLTITFIIIAISGIALHLAPSGRIAESIGWTFLGLNKDSWETIHTYLGFVMIGLVALHLLIGFNSMITMLRMGLKKSKIRGIAGIFLSLIVLSAGYIAFANYTAEESEDTSESYEEESPITGQMLKYYTVQELADYFNVSVDALIEKLREKGIECTPETKLAEIEYEYGLDREELKAMLEEIINELRG
ncbi:hypothetical protein A3L04_00645 [Thermococcus chitonophagus]|uniref:Flavinylation-associated cytochrome domain-containing protein n=1 Tax=Thermococcus chitonophagus TaxID=54262 RepID=A0A160VQD8_9EURY|nr:DUF4405 domain-containing protein [Thermococcus chitonophagus]ASJ15687.1 hypothetical protein A3L04_00645 [Thermococcus chitonophagus]CUX76900.1 hypothetical protein CHITON_0121 [Thermococcus chitonophagus]